MRRGFALFALTYEGSAGQVVNVRIQPQCLFRAEAFMATDISPEYAEADPRFAGFFADVAKEDVREGASRPEPPETESLVSASAVERALLSEGDIGVVAERLAAAKKWWGAARGAALRDYGLTAIHDVGLLLGQIREVREALVRSRKVKLAPQPGTASDVCGFFVGRYPQTCVFQFGGATPTSAFASWRSFNFDTCDPAIFINVQVKFRAKARWYGLLWGPVVNY